MSWLSGLNLGFVSPYWLALFPLAAGLLVFAYLRRGKGTRVPVGTLFLLRSLKRPVFSRKKFRPPPRFYFELLLLLLLIAGAAGLYKQGMGTRVAVLVDNSFSMARVEGDGTDLLSAAIRDAESLVRSLSGESRVEVFATSPRLRSISSGLVRPDRAVQDLKRIELAYAADSLDAAAQKLISDPSFERVYAFSDRSLQQRDGSGRLDIRTVSSAPASAKPENVAISHLALKSGAAQNSIEVSLASFLQGQARVRVILEALDSEGSGAAFKRVGEKVVALRGRSHEVIAFSDISPSIRAFRARLEPDSQGQSYGTNTIRQDDSAVLSIEAHGGNIALVSQFSPSELGLSNLRFAQFEQVKPEEYERDPSLLRQRGDLAAIFHRYLPPRLPEISSVFIAPVAGSDFLSIQGDISNVELTRWLGTHATLSYVNMASLKLAKAEILGVPPWAETLISSTRGPIAFVGEKDRRKYVGLGFEILPFEGKKSTLTSILTLNVLKYISDIGADVGFQTVGSRLFLSIDAQRAAYLEGEELFSAAQGEKAREAVMVGKPGLIKVESKAGAQALQAFNYYDENESDTLTHEPVAVDVPNSDPTERHDTTLLAGWIAALVGFALMLDLLFGSGLLKRLRLSRDAA
ncbi:MAG: VWA domain-containing protein [Deltaproteobacteria bacterium]|nr:VWA domain-containing protein [Deltaproteobacteria bacterium]